MKNTLIITSNNDDLVSSINDGTNRLFINDVEIPSNNWVGTGNYTTTVEGHNITIAKISALTGNIMIQKVSDYSYELVNVVKLIPVYQDENGNVIVAGDLTVDGGDINLNKNNTYLYGLYSDGVLRNVLQLPNANDNVIVGYGGYNDEIGATNIYGNNINLTSKNNIIANGVNIERLVRVTNSNNEEVYVGANPTTSPPIRGIIRSQQTDAITYDWFARDDYIRLNRIENGNASIIWTCYPFTSDLRTKLNELELTPTYKAGDSVSVNGIKVIGDVTNSKRALDFFIPLPKSAIGRTVTLNLPASNGLSVRLGYSGYLNGSQYLDVTGSNFTITCTPRFNGVSVRIANTNEYNITNNNTAVSVTLNGTLTFS